MFTSVIDTSSGSVSVESALLCTGAALILGIHECIFCNGSRSGLWYGTAGFCSNCDGYYFTCYADSDQKPFR